MIRYIENSNEVFISGTINKKNVGDAITIIHYINAKAEENSTKLEAPKQKPIKLYINSYGGSVYDAWSLISTILESKVPVHTICTGYAMSAAFVIFLAGDKRSISKNAILMFHQISSGNWGKYKDLMEDIEHLAYLQKQMEDFVVSRTKISRSTLKKVRESKHDWFITPEEAIKLGVADEISA